MRPLLIKRNLGDLHLAFAEHARRGGPEMKGYWDASHASPVEGVDAVLPAWEADEFEEALGRARRFGSRTPRNGNLLLAGRELAACGTRTCCEKLRGDFVLAAEERELAVWKKFKVSTPFTEGAPPKAIADTRRATTWEMVEGKQNAKARPVAKGGQTRIWLSGNWLSGNVGAR